ncbi:MAG: recombinase family protein [Ruminococcaceae bacterium]|nr:recombinase family protein [Oscillospiraceae bacterium]
MKQMIYGYIRVSSKDQCEDRQLIALQECSMPPDEIIIDKQSGKDFARPGYLKLMRRLKENDVLVIKSIDRLGRNYNEILEQWRIITKEKKARIVVLDMPLLDTSGQQDLISILISDIVLQLLSYVAQTEREAIRQRQREGIAAAKKRGVHFGRPAYKRPQNYGEILSRWQSGEISHRQAAALMGVSDSLLRKWIASDRRNTTE